MISSQQTGKLPEPKNYWQELFNQYFHPNTDKEQQALIAVKANLKALADASEKMPNEYDNSVDIRHALKLLADIPLKTGQPNESEWSLLLFGHALRSILELVGHYDVRKESNLNDEDEDEDNKNENKDENEEVESEALEKNNTLDLTNPIFMAAQAFNNALALMQDDLTERLADDQTAANTLAKTYLAQPGFYNRHGWFLLKYVMRSYVEFIFARSGLFNISYAIKKSRAIAVSAFELNKDIRPCLQPQASYPKNNKPSKHLPINWQQGQRGGKKYNPRHLIKLLPKNHLAFDYLQLLDNLDMPEIFTGLNFLQKTPWRINTQVLNTIASIYYPENPASLIGKLQQLHQEALKACTKTKHYEEALRIKDFNKPNSLIGSLLEQNKFYYPYQLDYRGRIYPAGGWLTPQGDGLAKALLEFYEGKTLPPKEEQNTDKAWLFLAVHGSQFIATQKIVDDLKAKGIEIKTMPTLEHRRQWILANNKNILESAANPLANTWWLETAKASEAWQFLAFCFAWQAATLGEPSHLPVHVDGSCNGLQHMAALTRDRVLAENTNLLPNDEQQDTYTWVLNAVKKQIEEQAQDKNSSWQPIAQWVLEAGDLLNRDIAKTVVMVFSYGSTDYGGKIQLYLEKEFASFISYPEAEQALSWYEFLQQLNKIRAKENLKGAYKVKGWAYEDSPPKEKYTQAEIQTWLTKQSQQSEANPQFSFVVDKTNDEARSRLTRLMLNSLAHYLASHFTQVMNSQLTAAVNLRESLLSWAKEITQATNLPITWVSPMGLAVSQIKNMVIKERASTNKKDKLSKKEIINSYFTGAEIDWRGLEYLTNSLANPDKPPVIIERLENSRRQIPEEVAPNYLKFEAENKILKETINLQKQQYAPFVPNFIHSLDASHLMLTLARSQQLNINAFSAVHDSFGTHAVDMPKLARALRDTFILLHKRPLLKKYQQWFTNVCDPDQEFNSLSGQVEGAVLGLIHNKWWQAAKAQQQTANKENLSLPSHNNELFDIEEVAQSTYIFF